MRSRAFSTAQYRVYNCAVGRFQRRSIAFSGASAGAKIVILSEYARGWGKFFADIRNFAA